MRRGRLLRPHAAGQSVERGKAQRGPIVMQNEWATRREKAPGNSLEDGASAECRDEARDKRKGPVKTVVSSGGHSGPAPQNRDRRVAELEIMGIPIDNISMDHAIGEIVDWLHSETARQVCFVNADCVNISCRDADYREVLNRADLCLADGMGLNIAGKLLSQPIRDNVNGTDMFPLLCQRLASSDRKIFLLGARPGVVEDVEQWIDTHFPGTTVCGTRHGYFSAEEESEIVASIRDSGAHLLLVAFGAPKQDLWIHRRLGELGVKVAIGVGGLFDFYSGRHARAPMWMRRVGLEWLHRLILEPRRLWKRYLIGNVTFLARVLKEKVSPKRP